ncbi:MAG: alanine--tRNA ligase [Bacteroidota bacterium]
MDSKSIRRKFLTFFEQKSHQIVPSAPLVIKDDPTLMFTNAGMNQFKDFFLGNKSPEHPRAADTQKCLRVSGKHNDLEEVGIDTYHHTMFEMLGNWSFGDYFKKEAIEWAWELLTEVYKLPKDRLYVTVFEGDKSDGLEADNEAFDYWKQYISEDRIIYAPKKDNFWEMGDTGPCGPCSEIHIDLRSDEAVAQKPGKELVNQDDPLVVEIWNLVFMQFNRVWDPEKGGAAELKKFEEGLSGENVAKATSQKHAELTQLEPLPAKHVDTGMGFERLVMAIQNKKSNYDTDVFQPLIQTVSKKAGLEYGQDEKVDIALRVISDHIRAISFAIADGQLPSNSGAGYVIRRILRRGVRYGYTFLNFRSPFLHTLVAILADQLEDVFPEIRAQEEFIVKVIQEEEASFLRTLEQGLKKLEQIQSDLLAKNEKEIPAELTFELYDTYGFPFDLTSLIAIESGFDVDEEGFKKQMTVQKSRGKADAAKESGNWVVEKDHENVEFIGYENLESESVIVKHRTIKQKGKDLIQVVLDKTPFYAESGGQVGDKGYLDSGSEKIRVVDTKKENDLIVHIVDKLPEKLDAKWSSRVDGQKRSLTTNNHSATHLLHAALRQVLGQHVEQRGSLVNEKILRFDFSHFSKMTNEEIEKVEQIVNAKIRENIELDEQRNVPIEQAKEMGAMALFGEKYGDFVRVITFDKDYSVELCGGTHVTSTGSIGLFKVVSESSIAAGVRRIEAITAETANNYVNDQLGVLEDIKGLLKDPKDLSKAIATLLDEKNKLEKELSAVQMQQAQSIKADLLDSVKSVQGNNVIIKKVKLPNADALKKVSFDLKNQVDDLFLVLAADIAGKPQISVVVSDKLISDRDMNAGNIVRELAKEIKGGGGGQPFFATAGGKDVTGLDKVIQKAESLLS